MLTFIYRRQYRPRQSSSSSSRSSSGSRSDASSIDDDDQISNEAENRLRSKDGGELLKKARGRSDSKTENIKEMSLKTKNNDKNDIKGEKRKQMSRSSSSSNSDDEQTKTSKKNKSEVKEIKKETKLDKELTIEEIKARYARRTTKEMVEEARQRYFLRKMERDQTKPYIFRSDE